jgi:hypothetical protein
MPRSSRCTWSNEDAWLGTAFRPTDTSRLFCPGARCGSNVGSIHCFDL